MPKGDDHKSSKVRVGIVPAVGYNFESMFVKKNLFYSEHEGVNPMCVVKEILEAKGIILTDAISADPSADIPIVLYFGNINIDMMLKYKNSVNIYFAYEPPVVDTATEKSNLYLLKKYFDYICDWNDDIVDGKVILKFIPCIDFFHCPNDKAFEDKKLLTSISGYKRSAHPDELYSERENVINYFETQPEEDFEFWGRGWHPSGYGNYKGVAVSKADIYINYKFAVCFENQKNIGGLVSEKIWDCFICKIVPVYWGSNNIEQYIPKECFIDYRDFDSIESLLCYLKALSKEEYEAYIRNAGNLLNSDKIYGFTAEAFADTIMGLTGKKKRVRLTNTKILGLKLLKRKIRFWNSIQIHGLNGTLRRILKMSAEGSAHGRHQ